MAAEAAKKAAAATEKAAAEAAAASDEAKTKSSEAAAEADAADNNTTEEAMEVETTKETETENTVTLPSLSDQLTLNCLWDTLSSCLRDLADTPDHHAVLVLQATVEAFFLVHAAPTQPEDKKKVQQKETRQEQLAHIQEQTPSIQGTASSDTASEAP